MKVDYFKWCTLFVIQQIEVFHLKKYMYDSSLNIGKLNVTKEDI